MKEAPERTPVLLLVDSVLADLAVRSAMYVARRRDDGDAETFVIQSGEEGRLWLSVPDRSCLGGYSGEEPSRPSGRSESREQVTNGSRTSAWLSRPTNSFKSSLGSRLRFSSRRMRLRTS